MNAVVAVCLPTKNTMNPIMSPDDFVALVTTLTANEIAIMPVVGENECECRQFAARRFLDRTTEDTLIFLDIGIEPHDYALEWLLRELKDDPKLGLISAVTLWWPNAQPNILQCEEVWRMDGFSLPQFAPAMEILGPYFVQHQDQHKRPGPVFFQVGGHLHNIDALDGGLFAIRREAIANMGHFVFHQFKGHYMGVFCRRVRELGFSTKVARNLICSNANLNHNDFLARYAMEVQDE